MKSAPFSGADFFFVAALGNLRKCRVAVMGNGLE